MLGVVWELKTPTPRLDYTFFCHHLTQTVTSRKHKVSLIFRELLLQVRVCVKSEKQTDRQTDRQTEGRI